MSTMPSDRREHNIVVLGAGGVGKSCLTAQLVQDVWIESYDPTIEDSYRKVINVDGIVYLLSLIKPPLTGASSAGRQMVLEM